jgi:hypothetical protein
MAKNTIAQYSATASSNTDVANIDIDEGMAPSNVNNALRAIMGHLKDMDVGTSALTSPDFTAFKVGGTTITATGAELNFVDGVTSNIQTQLNSKLSTLALSDLGVTATAAELNYNDLTTLGTSQASKVVTADANGVVTFDNGIVEESTAITSSSLAATLDLHTGTNFTHTLTENVTYTFSNPGASGRASAFTLKVTQDSTARTITWPSSVDWPNATAPTLSTTSGAVDVFVFVTYSGGTTYYGFAAGQAMG